MISIDHAHIAVIGLGYVGLPLASAFGALYPTIGYDIRRSRIEELLQQEDSTLEVTKEEIRTATKLSFSSTVSDLANCNTYIVTVPTPIDTNKAPDLTLLCNACNMLGPLIEPDDIVIFESTVYPGATEDVCVPILEKTSGLAFNEDFYVGYSPERINPGDKLRRLQNIVKVTSGSTPETADFVDELYGLIISAGTHKASSICVAEAAKVIENTQRDLNIALMNELAIIFDRLGIDTREVLEAAGTKWNFLPFRPGLVGGHCIGVDPYYLTHKAEAVGYHPEVILSGRRINDFMGRYIVGRISKLMNKNKLLLSGARVLILGLTFKENCPDIRNSRVFDVIEELNEYDANVEIYDPWVNPVDIEQQTFTFISSLPSGIYDAVIIAVGHDEFHAMGAEKVRQLCCETGIVYDVKSIFSHSEVDARL